MADVVVENILTFPSVHLGVGETAIARKVVPHKAFRLERICLVPHWSRLSDLLHAHDLRHIEVTSIKIGGEEQLDAPLPGALFSTKAVEPVRLPFRGRTAKADEVITVTLRDRGGQTRSLRRAVRRVLLHRQPIAVLVEGAQVRSVVPVGRVIGITATPMRTDAMPLTEAFDSRPPPDRN
jgi:hypothetical protein